MQDFARRSSGHTSRGPGVWRGDSRHDTQQSERERDADAHPEAAGLDAAIETLRPKYRRCIKLRNVEQRSYDDIAKTMRLPVKTVGSHIHRVRKQLKQLTGARLDGTPDTDRTPA